jgi:hypothetical protein
MERGCTESVLMRAHRLVACRRAKEILDKADKQKRPVTEQEVTYILQSWAFARTPFRVNVMLDGQNWVKSDTLGMLRDRGGRIHLTRATIHYPNVPKLINRWLQGQLPKEAKQFKWTSINLNCNYAAKRHCDGNNFGPSVIKAGLFFLGGCCGWGGEGGPRRAGWKVLGA